MPPGWSSSRGRTSCRPAGCARLCHLWHIDAYYRGSELHNGHCVCTGGGSGGGSDPAQFIVLAAALAFLVGGLLIISGLLRFGILVDFMSNPVLTGFIVGLALTIVAGQLDKMLGTALKMPVFFKSCGSHSGSRHGPPTYGCRWH
jgi:Sulfate permease family